MKKYVIINLIIIAGLIFYLVINANSKSVDERILVFNSSISYETNGNLDSAIAIIENSYQKFSSEYLFNIRLGWLYYSTGKFEKSLEYYNKSISIEPKNIESQIGATYPLAEMGKQPEIIQRYQTILKMDPMNYSANLYLGQIYLLAGDYTQAKGLIEKAQEQYPSYIEPNISLGWTYYYLGDKIKAKEHFIYALMLNSENESAKEGLALVD